jgi:hypothetical protein
MLAGLRTLIQARDGLSIRFDTTLLVARVSISSSTSAFNSVAFSGAGPCLSHHMSNISISAGRRGRLP